jgi:hypothetical protein
MQKCWSEEPYARPGFKYITDSLHAIYNREKAVVNIEVPLTVTNLNKHDERLGVLIPYTSDDSDDSQSKEIGNSF